MTTTLSVNGVQREVDVGEDEPLLYVLRDRLGLNGPKFGCGLAQCGACTVLVDESPVRSCVTPAAALQGARIETLEGLATPDGRLHPVQAAMVEEQAGQCAYCLNGIIMSAVALLRRQPRPTDAQIREALDGHLCRCGVHNRIVRAVQRVSAS